MEKKPKKNTQECLNNICIRFPTYENECYDKRTRILRTMVGSIVSFYIELCLKLKLSPSLYFVLCMYTYIHTEPPMYYILSY